MAWRVLKSGAMIEVLTGTSPGPNGTTREHTQVIFGNEGTIITQDLSAGMKEQYEANDDYVRSIVEFGEQVPQEGEDGEETLVWVAKGSGSESDEALPETDEALVAEVEKLRGQVKELQGSLDAAQSESSDKDSGVAQVQSDLAAANAELEQVKGELETASQQVAALQSEVTTRDEKIAELETELEEATSPEGDGDEPPAETPEGDDK